MLSVIMFSYLSKHLLDDKWLFTIGKNILAPPRDFIISIDL